HFRGDVLLAPAGGPEQLLEVGGLVMLLLGQLHEDDLLPDTRVNGYARRRPGALPRGRASGDAPPWAAPRGRRPSGYPRRWSRARAPPPPAARPGSGSSARRAGAPPAP